MPDKILITHLISNVIILMKFSSAAAPEVVKIIAACATIDNFFVKDNSVFM